MKKAIVPVLVLLVIGVGIFVARKLQAASPVEKTRYKIALADIGTVKKTVSATGTLQPWKTVSIKSKAGGRVNRMAVDVGSIVKAGDLIANIDPTDTQLTVNTAQADIDSATAKAQQSAATQSLQVTQSGITIQNAAAALQSAKASLTAARARLDAARASNSAQPGLTGAAVATAQANLNQAREARAQLDSTNPQDIETAKSALDQANANMANAKATVDRQRALLDKGFVSQQTVDTADAAYKVTSAQVGAARVKVDTIQAQQRANVQAADARVAQAQAQLDSARSGRVDILSKQIAVKEAAAAVKQASAQVSVSQATLSTAYADVATNKIRSYDVAQANASIARARATMVNAKVTLDQTTVRAPVAGVILKKDVDEGTIISSALSFAATGNEIVELGDLHRMYIDVTVDETDIANIDPGQAVDVTAEAYPDLPLTGKVIRIDPLADVVQNVTEVHVRVEVDNTAPAFRLLKPGLDCTCDFIVDKKDNVVEVPTEAVRSDDQGKFVEEVSGGTEYIPTKDSGDDPDPNILVDCKVVQHRVETSLDGNDTIAITSGVKQGDKVVVQTIEPEKTQATGALGGGFPGMGQKKKK